MEQDRQMEGKQQAQDRAKGWLSSFYDQETRDAVSRMLEDESELVKAFGGTLEFGTGGLRAVMGTGTRRMNVYTVRQATQGLANYLLQEFAQLKEIRVAISFDCRNNSQLFAASAADTLAANGIKVYLYQHMRPTPQLSFTVRHLHCQAGIMITASHNPKEYNGYKVYWDDGAQVVAPHDKAIMEEVAALTSPESIKHDAPDAAERIITLGAELDEAYIDSIVASRLLPAAAELEPDLSVVYTPIHGAGSDMVPRTLFRMGFRNVRLVNEQFGEDGNFSTVTSPNPEDPKAMALALQLAKDVKAQLVLGTDPDADRMGAYAADGNGELIRLNGDQIGVLLAYYVIFRHFEMDDLPDNGFIVRSIVTTPLLDEIAKQYSLAHYTVLTGFKYIAKLIRQFEGEKVFLMGCEESHGYLVGDAVRDKDAVQACALFCEMAVWAKHALGLTLIDLLQRIYARYGYYGSMQRALTISGAGGQDKIASRMRAAKEDPSALIPDRAEITRVYDYLSLKILDAAGKVVDHLDTSLRANVLQIETDEGMLLTIRPSGTEPKIKYYVSCKCPFQDWERTVAEAEVKMREALTIAVEAGD